MASDGRSDRWKERPLNDTIFALSSGSLPAAIAVVRISGPEARHALEALGGVAEPRRARLATLSWDGEVLDRALTLFFDGPATATGEDVAELHLHGGRAVVAAILAALSRLPRLRPAESGEFTRRSFQHGRIDLAEAEGLADLLAAETESQRRAALRLASGSLSRKVAAWTSVLLQISAAVEAELDFSDEDDVPSDTDWRRAASALLKDVDQLLSQPTVERLTEGIRVVIAGPPNAGKSSLLNALVGREAAITSPHAGTTRDVIEAPAVIAGVPILFMDTAGLRSSDDEVEAIGIDRARRVLDNADIILWLGAPNERPAGENVLVVHSKTDLAGSAEGADIAVSALTGTGLAELLAMLHQRSETMLPLSDDVLNRRHQDVIREAVVHLGGAIEATDLLIVAEELRLVRRLFDGITGRTGVENMLDTLFARFCIGK